MAKGGFPAPDQMFHKNIKMKKEYQKEGEKDILILPPE